jgi:hypothetical protein
VNVLLPNETLEPSLSNVWNGLTKITLNQGSFWVRRLYILAANFPTQSRKKCPRFKPKTNLDLEWFMQNQFIHLKEKALKFRLISKHSLVSMQIFVQLALQSTPFYAKIIPSQGYAGYLSLAVMYLLWQNRWLWCHSSNWFIKYISLILMSSRTFFVNE